MENIITSPPRSTYFTGKIESHCNHVFIHDSKTRTSTSSNSDHIFSSLHIPSLNSHFQKIPKNLTSEKMIMNRNNLKDMRQICTTLLSSKLLHLAERESPLKTNAISDDDSCCNDSKDDSMCKESLSSIEMKKSYSNSPDVSNPKLTPKKGSDISCRAPTSPLTTSRLTLSAYRRPEVTVRITDCNPKKSLRHKYRLFPNKVLGYGASSTVRLALNRSNGQRVAVKSIPKHVVLRELKRLEEVALLRRLDHPNIVTLHDVYENENEIQMVMECCEGGELYDTLQNSRTRNLLESYGERSVVYILKQLLSALEYIHSRGVVHRDVKPENILLVSKDYHLSPSSSSKMEVKLSDFGLARILHEAETTCPCSPKPTTRKRKLADVVSGASLHSPSYKSPVSFPLVRTAFPGTISIPLVPKFSRRKRAYSRCGSDYYSAPEMESGMGYDTAVDMYALGVTTYVLLCGRFPPNPNDSAWNSTELFTEPQWKLASSQAKDFVRSMLDPDPCTRITADEALRHNWMTMNNANNSNISYNNNYYCEHLNSKPKLDSITLDLDLLCNTTDFVVDAEDVIASDDDETDDAAPLPLRQFGLV